MHILTIPHPYMKRLLTAAFLALCVPLVSLGQKPYGNFEEYPLDLLERPNLRWLSDREVVFPEMVHPELWRGNRSPLEFQSSDAESDFEPLPNIPSLLRH